MDPDARFHRYLAENDEDAMASLVHRTRPRLLAVARGICSEEAEDTVQTAYVALVRKGEHLRAPVLPWLLTAVVRISYRHRARRSREHAIAEQLTPEGTPLAKAMAREESQLLRREVGKLPNKYRDAMILHHLQGLSHAETARLLDVNESTLRTRLQRGRLLLRSRLSPKILYPILALPWFLADHAVAAIAGGIVVKSKAAALAVLAVVLLLAGGTIHFATRDGESPPPRAPVATREAPRSAEVADEAGDDVAEAAADERTRLKDVFAAGVVVDDSGAPVQGVRVLVRRVRPDVTGRRLSESLDDEMRTRAALAVTDANGCFEVEGEPKDASSLVFFKEHFVPAEVSCIAEGAEFDRQRGYVRFESKRPGRDMRVVLSGGRTLAGTVRDLSGVPLPGANVYAYALGVLRQQMTADEEGRYEFTTLPRDLTVAAATEGGYELDTRRGEIGAEVHFRLKRRFMLVDVTDAVTGKAVAGAGGIVVETGSGRFLTSLHPGGMSYDLGDKWRWVRPGRIYRASNIMQRRVGPGDPVRVKLYLFAAGYQPSVEEAELRRGHEPPHLRVKLTPGEGPPSIAGVVRGAEPALVEVRYAFLTTRDGNPLLMSTETDAAGRFAFSGLPPGRHRLVVAAEDVGDIVRDVEAPALDLVIELQSAAALVVLAKDRAGRPVADTAIHVEPLEGKRYWKEKTDEDGRVRFAEIPAGEVRVAAVIEGYRQVIRRWEEVPHRELVLKAGKEAHIEVTVPKRIPYRLLVTDEHGAPLSGVDVRRLRPHRGFVSVVGSAEWKRLKEPGVTTNAAGEATIDLYPGEYEVTVARGAMNHFRRIQVAEESRSANIVILASGLAIRGHVREMTSNRPLPRCAVRAYVLGSEPRQFVETTTGKDGTFRVEALPAARLHLSVDPRTLAQQAGVGEPTHAVAFRELTLERDVDLEVILPRIAGDQAEPRGVSFHVLAREGDEPAAGAFVTVSARLGDFWVRLGRGHTDAAGLSVLPVITAPRYTLAVSGRKGRVEKVIERVGSRVEVTIELSESAERR